MPRAIKKSKAQSNVSSIFSGYPTAVIMQWCGVSRVTACLWKRGERMPSKRAVRMFFLHSQGQVVPRTWAGWRFNEKTGDLVSPEGWTFNPGRIRAYEIMNRNAAFRDLYQTLPSELLVSLGS